MKNRKVFTLLLAGLLTFSMGSTAYASGTDAAIADAQAQKQAAEAGLAQVQDNISSLEGKRQELESYLADLNAQYEDLTNSIAELSVQAAEKEDELNKVKAELTKAKNAADEQYDSMKLRIQYMYENGGSSALELLLSSESLAEFLNRAESVAQISQYDRDMLQKYENLQKSIQENEETIEKESADINNLMTERASKQQEVQVMAASTSDNINSYVSQISASQAEADQLMSEITSADNNITALVQQAEAERAAEEKAAAAKESSQTAVSEDNDNGDSEAEQDSSSDEAAEVSETDTASQSDTEDTYSEEDYGYDPEEDTTESSSSSTSSEVTVEEEEDEEEDNVPSAGAEDTSESDYTEESTSEDVTEDVAEDTIEDTTEDTTEDTAEDTTESDAEESTSTESSGQGKYLGNFTLTAYCNCAQCCGTAGNLTASGTVPTAGRTVAMAGVPFGTQLLINGNVYTVEDLGTPYGHVDIYCGSHEEALSFGLQSAEVYQLN